MFGFALLLLLQTYCNLYQKRKKLKTNAQKAHDKIVFQGLCVGNSSVNSGLRLLPTVKQTLVSVSTHFSFYAPVMRRVFIISETYYESQNSLLGN